MKHVRIECKPDELLVSKLGFSKKKITHYQGKSRVFKYLEKNYKQLAIVDEDTGSSKSNYEKRLKFVEEKFGIKYYKDNSENKIFILTGKLEDWIIGICKKDKVKLSNYGLPEDPNDLHDVINQKLIKFASLLDNLIKTNNPSLMKLKAWLK